MRYVDPSTGAESRVVGIPVNQNGSWLEGWEGQATVDVVGLRDFEGLTSQKQFFVLAHDGDNSGGRAGSLDTWLNGRAVTCSSGVQCLGIDEYLAAHTPATTDVVHVQDGSWVDTRDSSSDPQWHHWRLPFGIWKGQFPAFNSATGLNLAPKTNLSGVQEGMTVSLEHGWHYLERNFALLQAALNYAKTAEQLWLDAHPHHWEPSTALDSQVTHAGNQLNPWMLSFPVKGDAANDWAGGANPAELAWYFLLPAMDSGFGYYDENVDDNVKPTLSFNQSLYFSKPYVQDRLAQDRTGPSIWWPQRWPYNPGSANTDKSEGWTLHHFDNTFALYTYAFDVSGITSIKARVRVHTAKRIDPLDNTPRVYDPVALKAAGVPGIDPSRVGAWVDYPLQRRELRPVMNGVAWQPASLPVMQKVAAQEIGDLYSVYLGAYRDQLLDYYIEATDARGNVTRSELQSVYVGAGRYRLEGGKYIEDLNGSVTGTHPFLRVDTTAPSAPSGLSASSVTSSSVGLSWTAARDNYGVSDYLVFRDGIQVAAPTATTYTDTGLSSSTTYSYAVKARDAAGNTSVASSALSVTTGLGYTATVYYKKGFATPYLHYRPAGGAWTTPPGVPMPDAEVAGYAKYTVNLGAVQQLEAVFNNGSGTWDNNNGGNYLLPTGTSTFNAGVITAGAPVSDTTAPSVPTGLTSPSKSATTVSLSWIASTDNVGVTGYLVLRDGTQVGTPTSTSYTDSGLSSNTAYSYTVKARDAAGNTSAQSTALSVTTSTSGATVTFNVTASTVMGQNVYVVGNVAALGSWSPANAILLSPANYPTWSAAVGLPGSTAIEYKFIKKDAANNVTWENGANRTLATPATGTTAVNDTWR